MICDKVRNAKEVLKLFNKRPMQTDVYDFEFIINNPHLYCFYDEENNKLRGIIFITENDNKLFLSGVSVEKNFSNNVDAVVKVCEAYGQDIYSDTDLRHAVLVLKKAGFEKYKNNIYIRRHKNG